MLARFHRAASGFRRNALESGGAMYHPSVVLASLDRLVAAWRLYGTPGLETPVRLLREHVAELERRFAAHGRLPRVVIHGDYYADNLLFKGDRIVGVVDYDKARWQARVAEIAEAVIYFGSPRPGTFKFLVYPGCLNRDPLAQFLSAYGHETDVTEREARALPDYIRAIWISVSCQQLVERRGPECAAAALAEVVALADWSRDQTRFVTASVPTG
jgi:Ser/Thr protein kinase RdoA (MazF antagonist)